MEWIWVVVAVVAILLIAYISCLNNLKKTNVKVDEALSDIDVALEKRYDQLTKLLSTVKGYAKHEAETLANIVNLRKGQLSESTMAEKNEITAKMDQAFKEANIVVERYPELKAEKTFVNLMNAISDVEDHLQAARRLYNSNVSALNSLIVTFPTNVVAKMGHVQKREFFEASAEKKNDVKIEF